MMKIYIKQFLREKPFFFSIIRPKEASLYQQYKPFKKPVLDIGCGDGFFAKVAFGKIDVGIDVDKKALEEATKRNIYDTCVHYNGEKIPYKNGYFSTILCNSTFEHIPNPEQVLQEAARVLREGGTMYFTVPTDIWPSYLFGTIFLGKIYINFFNRKQKHYNLYDYSQWYSKLSHIGLKVKYHTYYLDNKKIIWLFDISHYLSVFSLMSKKIFDRWVLFPEKVTHVEKVIDFLQRETEKNSQKGSCLFIVAEKMK